MKNNKGFFILILILMFSVIILGSNSVSASDSSDLLEDSSSDLSLSHDLECADSISEAVEDNDMDNGKLSASDLNSNSLNANLDSDSLNGDSNINSLNEDSNANSLNVNLNSDSLNEVPDSIYVSKNGSDNNVGSESAPLASISKAVELAKDKSAKIIINEGTYNENNITIDTNKPLSIEGQSNVFIDGTGLDSQKIFYILSSSSISIKNISFTNNVARSGAAIRINDESRNMLHVNITVENCRFSNLNASRDGGAIGGEYLNGTVLIKDSTFTNNNATSWGGAIYLGYSAYPDCLSLEIINSSFEGNYANNGGALYLMLRNISISNSNITHNEAKYYPGALYMQNCTARLDNCIISDNVAGKDKAAIAIHGASISYNPTVVNPSNVVISNCIIENNTVRQARGAAIYLENSNLNMSFSSIVNDLNVNNSVTANYNDDQPGIVILNNNWWETDDPSSTVVGNNTVLDNWVIMNLKANASYVSAGGSVKVIVDFNHVKDTAGGIGELIGGTIPKDSFTVLFTAQNGTVIPETLSVSKGGTGEAILTASDSNAKLTANCSGFINELVFSGEGPGPYSGIVYLSKESGASDDNEGSESAPVASLAKAIAIATAENGSGQIIIKEGTYTGSNYQITKDLEIAGIGNVIIDGEGQGRLFYMSYGTEPNKFSLSNLTLSGASYGYGAVVYSFARETILGNVKIINNPGAGDLITTYGNAIIKDSLISGHNGGDVIEANMNGDFIINNTRFENNNVSEYGVVYIAGGSGNLIIEYSDFINNSARLGIIKGSSGTNIDVKGSSFINNSVTVGFGGAISATDKLLITESLFINNNANRDGGAVHVGSNGDATITKSMFVNNSAGNGYYGDAIYNSNKAAANYCIFLTNSTHYIIFNDRDNAVNAQYNWWGTNDNPSSLVAGTSRYDEWDDEYIEYPAPDVSNWILMNVMADTSNAKTGSPINISADFNHYFDNSTDDIRELEGRLGQELTVEFNSSTGGLDKRIVETDGLIAAVTYTPVEGFNSIAVKSSNANISIPFNAITGIETNLTADEVIEIEFGSGSLEIALSSLGNPLKDKLIIARISDEISLNGITDDAGIARIDLSSVPVGIYNAEIRFDGDALYYESSAFTKITVNEAPKTSNDLQKLIDETPEGAILNLSNVEFVNVSGIIISKDISIEGENLTIVTAGDGNPVFEIASNLSNVSISGIEFKANNGDVLVKATAINGTDELSIANPAIQLKNNKVTKANEDVVSQSITLFKLESERAVLATSNPIDISDNDLDEGIKAFKFEIAGLNNASSINIPKGGNINADGNNSGNDSAIVKEATAIAISNMKTTAVSTAINGKNAGKNFSITLKDSKGNVLSDKEVIISFNGKVYKVKTDAKGVASVKVALSKKGTYPVAVSFLGDDKYNGTFAVAKIVVNPQKVKLTVSKKKYKVKSKKKYLVAALKASNKKAIKGKKIVFTVNGKKYTAKTNKKGIAKVNVKLSKKGTYRFTVKFAGDNTFKAISKKGKVVVK